MRDRIRFVPRMDFAEFNAFVKLANVILDPYPVGGGRSSLEIFSTGTPVVMHYEKTHILQLTYGQYRTMGVEGGIAYSDDEYVDLAVNIATDREEERRMRGEILANVWKLYDSDGVTREWEEFIECVRVRRKGGKRGHERSECKFSAAESQKGLEWVGGVRAKRA